jgi:hypothetical protein
MQGDLRGIMSPKENATHNTLQQKAGHRSGKCPGFSPDELRVAFSIPSGSLFLVNHPVCKVDSSCKKPLVICSSIFSYF